mmetsp:Transcript_44741/g.124086  ORF Transcript_44741/g.124086 Transcript_44741/m.124086 type:complete len:108 (+) Transcript_44741:199-522(+)
MCSDHPTHSVCASPSFAHSNSTAASCHPIPNGRERHRAKYHQGPRQDAQPAALGWDHIHDFHACAVWPGGHTHASKTATLIARDTAVDEPRAAAPDGGAPLGTPPPS